MVVCGWSVHIIFYSDASHFLQVKSAQRWAGVCLTNKIASLGLGAPLLRPSCDLDEGSANIIILIFISSKPTATKHGQNRKEKVRLKPNKVSSKLNQLYTLFVNEIIKLTCSSLCNEHYCYTGQTVHLLLQKMFAEPSASLRI